MNELIRRIQAASAAQKAAHTKPLNEPLPRESDITGWCRFCERSAAEVQQAALEEDDEMDSEELMAVTTEGFCVAMPIITSRESAQCFIACVARGLALGLLTNDTAGKLVYVAQTALSAHRR